MDNISWGLAHINIFQSNTLRFNCWTCDGVSRQETPTQISQKIPMFDLPPRALVLLGTKKLTICNWSASAKCLPLRDIVMQRHGLKMDMFAIIGISHSPLRCHRVHPHPRSHSREIALFDSVLMFSSTMNINRVAIDANSHS